jgi:predicted nucleic-acid-binding protein
MTGVDTNVLVRFLTGDDEKQSAAARRFLKGLGTKGETAFISLVVLAELAWVLTISYGFDRGTLADVVERLLQTAEIEIEAREVVSAALEAFRSGRADFADHLIGARNEAAGCDRTATFDRALRGDPRSLVL